MITKITSVVFCRDNSEPSRKHQTLSQLIDLFVTVIIALNAKRNGLAQHLEDIVFQSKEKVQFCFLLSSICLSITSIFSLCLNLFAKS
jgi:F0F1-type ATP synthase membrane subunit a